MTIKNKPRKLENVEKRIRAAIESGNYVVTAHAFDRQTVRMITLPETLHVLKPAMKRKEKAVLIFTKMLGSTLLGVKR